LRPPPTNALSGHSQGCRVIGARPAWLGFRSYLPISGNRAAAAIPGIKHGISPQYAVVFQALIWRFSRAVSGAWVRLRVVLDQSGAGDTQASESRACLKPATWSASANTTGALGAWPSHFRKAKIPLPNFQIAALPHPRVEMHPNEISKYPRQCCDLASSPCPICDLPRASHFRPLDKNGSRSNCRTAHDDTIKPLPMPAMIRANARLSRHRFATVLCGQSSSGKSHDRKKLTLINIIPPCTGPPSTFRQTWPFARNGFKRAIWTSLSQ